MIAPEQCSSPPVVIRSATERPRILYLSPYWPNRATSASEVRALHIGRALQEFGRLQMVVVDSEGRSEEPSPRGDCEFDVAYSVGAQPAPKRKLIQKVNWALNPSAVCPHGIAV